MKKTVVYIASAAALGLPLIASAQTITSVQSLSLWLINFINHIAVPFVFAAAFIVFIYGVFETLILGRGNEEKAQAGRSLIIWGVVGFVVMLSIWGLVNVALNTFNLNNAAPNYPSTPYTP